MGSLRAPRIDGRRSLLAPLVILLPALILGLLAMHIWMGGHSSTAVPPDVGPATSHSVSAESDSFAHSSSHHADRAGTDNLPAAGHSAPAHGSDAQCGGMCGSMNMTMATCVLALVFLSLTLLLPPVAGPLRALPQLWRVLPVLTRTSAPAKAPSLVQLSISRT